MPFPVVTSYFQVFHNAQSYRFDFVLSWNFISRTILTFYDLVESYNTNEKWQWRQGYLFCFESYYSDKKKCFFRSAYFFLSIWSE